MTKLTVTFRNFTNAPKNGSSVWNVLDWQQQQNTRTAMCKPFYKHSEELTFSCNKLSLPATQSEKTFWCRCFKIPYVYSASISYSKYTKKYKVLQPLQCKKKYSNIFKTRVVWDMTPCDVDGSPEGLKKPDIWDLLGGRVKGEEEMTWIGTV